MRMSTLARDFRTCFRAFTVGAAILAVLCSRTTAVGMRTPILRLAVHESPQAGPHQADELAARAGRFLGKLPADFVTHFVNSARYYASSLLTTGGSDDQANTETNSYSCEKSEGIVEHVAILTPNRSRCSRYSIGGSFKFLLRHVAQLREAISRTVPNLFRAAIRLLK